MGDVPPCPVAWLGPALGFAGATLFTVAVLPAIGDGSRQAERQYAEPADRLAGVGMPLRPGEPVISNFPIWIAETARVSTLALPDEPPAAVLDLARQPAFAGTRLVVVEGAEHRHWPADIDAGAPGAECFREIDIRAGAPADDPLAETHIFEVICP